MTAIKRENKMAPIVSRGFRGRRAADVDPARVPPGQYVTQDFPVLSAGPTPHTSLELWDFSIVGELDEPRGWTWEEFRALPSEEITRDIHCVTKWSKVDPSCCQFPVVSVRRSRWEWGIWTSVRGDGRPGMLTWGEPTGLSRRL